ncbi:MAG: TRAP transporter large permease, partial [Desulfobacterales bacterium]|nr:TRAP transporter large permease [Desulfobacterales bacterium]
LILLGLPLFLSIGCSALITIFFFLPDLPLELIPQNLIGGIDSFSLLAIPFFFLAGEIMNSGGQTRRIIRFAEGLVGTIPGGLAHVNVITNVIYAGISGAAVADAAAIGSIMIPAMKKAGYPARFTAAINAAAATIGPIFPPSIPMIIYGVIANVSVGRLFLAGVIPGLIMGLYFMITCFVLAVKRGYPNSEHMQLEGLLKRTVEVFWALMSPAVIVGGILLGVFTPTEAGAVAVLYSAIIGGLVYRELTLASLVDIFRRTLVNSATVLILVGTSQVFGWVVAQSNIGADIGRIMLAVSKNPQVILLELNILFLVIGMIMDPLAALIIFVPIFLPITQSVGVDPVHFGLVVVLNLMIGLSTPPVGYLLYMTSALAEVQVEKVIVEILPFLAVMLIILIMCTYWPQMVMYLPNMMR